MEQKVTTELRTDAITRADGVASSQGASFGLKLYLVFMVSWFLHVPARLEILGVMRIDLLLVVILMVLAVSQPRDARVPPTDVDKWLKVLIIYAALTIPLVEWPGSVLKNGFPNLVKAVVFYFFTVAFVKTEADLRKFITVFLACQVFRILEPLYLHLVWGYWGSHASMANWETMDRLAGAPSDIVNPNGLAFVVCTVLPFLYSMARLPGARRLLYICLAAAALYALILTGSRSGMVGLAVIYIGIMMKSKRRLVLAVAGLLIVAVGVSVMSPDMRDRYLSIVGAGSKNASTADERWEGTRAQFDVALHRPFFGHGLGTSAEANANFTKDGPYAGWAIPAHNLYLEVAQELGVFGLVIFLFFMKAVFTGFRGKWSGNRRDADPSFVSAVVDAMQVWLLMNVVFSFASFGLSGYEWYLFAGVSVVIQRVAARRVPVATTRA